MKVRLTALAISAIPAMLIAGSADNFRVAEDSINDGLWKIALKNADLAEADPAFRDKARLISLVALDEMGNEAEIERRLSGWNTSTGDEFRYWRVRSAIKGGKIAEAKELLAKPFDESLRVNVAVLKAAISIAEGKYGEGLAQLEADGFRKFTGEAGDEAKFLAAEMMEAVGRKDESEALMVELAANATAAGIRLRAGLKAGFAEIRNKEKRKDGIARIRSLVRKNPDSEAVRLAAKRFAEELLNLGLANEAEDEYRRYFESYQQSATDEEALEGRGRTLSKLGRHQEAAGYFGRAAAASRKDETVTRCMYEQADEMGRSGKYDESAELFAKTAKRAGSFAMKAKLAEADMNERSGNTDKAIQIYNRLISENGEIGQEAQIRYAAIEARNGRFDSAIEMYSKLLANKDLPKRFRETALRGRGRAEYHGYRFKEAKNDFAESAKLNGAQADEMAFLVVLCMYGEGLDAEAMAAADKLMASTTNEMVKADVTLWSARCAYNRRDYRKATELFGKYAEMRKGKTEAIDALIWMAKGKMELSDFQGAIDVITTAAKGWEDNPGSGDMIAEALSIQGEALMESARFGEAVQVLDTATKKTANHPMQVKILAAKADALYAMGAGDDMAYVEAVKTYREIAGEESLSRDRRLECEFKTARALEKMHRIGEAMEQYYRNVVLAYCDATEKGVLFGTAARSLFSRAAFAIADYCESAGDFGQAEGVLTRVVESGVQAADEAKRRIAEIREKGVK